MNPTLLALADKVVLLFAPHPDDAEIGAGGFLLQTAGLGEKTIYTFSGDDQRQSEAAASAQAFAARFIAWGPYPDGLLPNYWDDILQRMFDLRAELERDGKEVACIFCPRTNDRHQDHRVVAENVWRVFRDHLILEYEVPNYDENLVARPNVFVPLAGPQATRKAQLLWENFPSRRGHGWWSQEIFLAFMRMRGLEANVEFAEGFVAKKLVLQAVPASTSGSQFQQQSD